MHQARIPPPQTCCLLVPIHGPQDGFCQMGWRMAELASNPTAAWRVGTGSRADNVPWSPGPGSCPRTCCTPCTLPWAMYMPDHMRRRPSERLLRRRPRQSRPSVMCCDRGEVEVEVNAFGAPPLHTPALHNQTQVLPGCAPPPDFLGQKM